jgi:hypothetical protein
VSQYNAPCCVYLDPAPVARVGDERVAVDEPVSVVGQIQTGVLPDDRASQRGLDDAVVGLIGDDGVAAGESVGVAGPGQGLGALGVVAAHLVAVWLFDIFNVPLIIFQIQP